MTVDKIDVTEYAKEINKLDAMGIHYDKYNEKTNELFFSCDSHPYLPKPNDEARRIFGKIGNTWNYIAGAKKLVIGRFGKWQPSLLENKE